MGNTFITPSIIAKEALLALENNLVLGGLVHRQYSTEFQKVGATVTIRKPATFTSSAVSGTVNWSTVTESSVTVVLDQNLDITIPITSTELTLNIVDFSEQIIQPIMRAHAQKVDELIAGLYSDVCGHYAVSGTPTVSDIAGVRAVQNILKVPTSERRLVLHPNTEAAYLSLASFLNAEKRGDTRAIKDANLGRIMGYEVYMSQNMEAHTGGNPTGGTATPLLQGAGSSAATACTVDAVVSGSTVLAGDLFKVVGYDQWHRVGTNATANVGTIVLDFAPAFAASRADDSTVTFQRSFKANMAFHKNAFALVVASLEPPIGGAKASVINYKGLATRCVYDYGFMQKRNVMSIDLLVGVKTLDRDLAAILCDAN